MLIRSSQLTLERRRVPLGDLRVSEFARSLNVRGLWIFSPRYLTVDLTGNSPPLTWQGSAAIRGGIEGPAIDCSPSTTSGARLTFGSSSPLNITTGPGLSTFVRVARTANAPGSNAPYFGIGFQGWANPFVVSLIGTTGTTIGAPSWNWNTAGTLRQFQVFSDIWPAHTPTSFALSHAFNSRVDAYYAGQLHNSNTTNTAAPSFGGSSDILCFGYDGVNARNSQASMFTGAVFAHPLSGSEAAALEAEPYALVEQRPLFLSMLSAGGANIQAGLTDTGAAADTVAGQVTLLGALADAVAAGEVVLVNGTFQAAASDSAAAGDTLAAIGTLQAAMADSAAASDTVVSASVLVSLLAESATADDAVTGGVALISLVSDSAAAADSVVSSSAYASAIADSVSATDAVLAAATLLCALAETITAADAASAAAQLQAQIAEALAAADLPIAVLSGLGTITESVVLADVASAIATLNVTLSEAVATGDAITAPSAATYQINVSVAWAAPAEARIWSAPSRSRTWAAPTTPRV